MPMIDANDYQDLNQYSNTGSSPKEKGPFTKIFISGEQREDQNVRKMHAIYSELWDSDDLDKKYLIRNKEVVNFVIMFIKKVRVKKERVGNNNYDTITYFSWDPDNESFPEGAKCEYIFAGVLLDENYKTVQETQLKEDEEPRGAFVYFLNVGIKVGPAVEFLGKLADAAKDLEPLSNDENFEKTVVTPRRFITQVKIGFRPSGYGNKDVFEYDTIKKLPDAAVGGENGIMKKCQKWSEIFEKQFHVKSNSGTGGSPSSVQPDNQNPTFDDSETKESEVDIADEDIDIGI